MLVKVKSTFKQNTLDIQGGQCFPNQIQGGLDYYCHFRGWVHVQFPNFRVRGGQGFTAKGRKIEGHPLRVFLTPFLEYIKSNFVRKFVFLILSNQNLMQDIFHSTLKKIRNIQKFYFLPADVCCCSGNLHHPISTHLFPCVGWEGVIYILSTTHQYRSL